MSLFEGPLFHKGRTTAIRHLTEVDFLAVCILQLLKCKSSSTRASLEAADEKGLSQIHELKEAAEAAAQPGKGENYEYA